ncbi:hypothetical protein H6F97_14835 [Microcoleus sp. FACHB-1]|nr:hypothetical protein [Microcoleus sp. FACHB-1]
MTQVKEGKRRKAGGRRAQLGGGLKLLPNTSRQIEDCAGGRETRVPFGYEYRQKAFLLPSAFCPLPFCRIY